jgi:hypothetical protein
MVASVNPCKPLLSSGLPTEVHSFPCRGGGISIQIAFTGMSYQSPLIHQDYTSFFDLLGWYKSCLKSLSEGWSANSVGLSGIISAFTSGGDKRRNPCPKS